MNDELKQAQSAPHWTGRKPSLLAQLAALLVRIYQLTLSPMKQIFFGSNCSCRFQPTCSCYTRSAFLQYGFWRGWWYAFRRILRCHPWHPGGYDPLPCLNKQPKEGISAHHNSLLDG
jgi:putative membrane protein insertion efficiency factor